MRAITNSQPNPRQRGDDVLHHPISESIPARVTAQILEGKDCDRRLVGKSPRSALVSSEVTGSVFGEPKPSDASASLTSPMNRNPLRAMVRTSRCSSPESPIALRTALI